MIRTFRYSFILAKVYGMLARTYVGRNYEDLLRLRKLEELSRRIFPETRGASTQPDEGADEMEQRIGNAAIRSMMDILSLLHEPVELLVHLLRVYEYQSLKSVIRAAANGRPEESRVWDLGKYSGIRLVAGEDNQKAIASSVYSWILEHLQTRPLYEIENMLDRDYYTRLLRLSRGLPARDRRGVERLVTLEVSLSNVTWALRLRFFFGMDWAAAQPLLFPGLGVTHRTALSEAFEIPPDSIEGWKKWKYSWLVEDQLGESFRSPDPIRAEQKASRRMYVRAHQLFHEDPFTITPIAAFFKLKQVEASMLTTAVEALRLSVAEQDVLSIAGGA
jgi:vacuolar-type H+-ATPase subunit C/Vma6